MKKIFEKIKPILLLAGMSLVSFVSVWVVSKIRTVFNQDMVQEKQAYVLNEPRDSTVELETIDLSQPEKIEELEKEIAESGLSEEEVLGSEKYRCEADSMEIESESVCYRNTTDNIDYNERKKEGTVVNRESTVELVKVTVPLDLYSGMVVADSNRKITKETPTFKAAGEQVDETLADTLLPPGQKISTHRPWVAEEPFLTSYSMGFGTSYSDIKVSNEGEIGVNSKLPNDCDSEEYNNISNINPDKSNKISSFIRDAIYRYPKEKDKVKEEDLIEVCDDTDRFVKWTTDMVACTRSTVIAWFKTIGDALWNKCEEDEGNCIFAEDIVVIMASPFGSEEECNEEGVCTNAYMKVRNDSATEPLNTDGNKFYYTTDCEAMIEGKSVIIQCAWDMSHLYKERKVNEFDDLPNLEDTPSENEYNDFLLNDVKGKRTVPVPL